MVVLQALVEGMVLEVHVTNRLALSTGATTPLVEIYTQFGSQVYIHIVQLQYLSIYVYTCCPVGSLNSYIQILAQLDLQ